MIIPAASDLLSPSAGVSLRLPPFGPAQLAYINSASHSGSTLLAMLLGAHPEACTVGELRAPSMGDPEVYQCSCGQRIKECSFWSRVSRDMQRRGIERFHITDAQTSVLECNDPNVRRLLEPLLRGAVLEAVRDGALSLLPSWRRHRSAALGRTTALVHVLRELTGAKVIIDSSKSALQLKYLLREPSLKIKVIWMVRDGRAVSLSLMGHGLKRATRPETIAAAAREWRRSNEAAGYLLWRLPRTDWIEVRYEELCERPQAVVRRICEFLGLDPEKVNLDFRSRQQHVLGNEMRLKSTSEIRLDERWKKELTAEDLEVFQSEAGALNRQYGYG